METELRALLYNHLEGHKVAFNPVEPEPFDLVDLTKDVTNSTRIYHLQTQCVREALEGATLIVTDSEPLANAVRQVLPGVVVAALPYGHIKGGIAPLQRDPEESHPFGHSEASSQGSPVIGLLNHDGATEMNNAYSLSLLKEIGRPCLIFGHALPGVEGEVEEDFSRFAARCDILLLPSLPGVINSITVPLAMMESGTAVLAAGAPGYWNLDAATGVQLLPNDPAAWHKMLALLEQQPAKLQAMQERNRAFAVRLNRESFSRLAPLLPLPQAGVAATLGSTQGGAPRRKSVSQDCGCTKQRRSATLGNKWPVEASTQGGAPTRPVLDQPIVEKEIVQK